MKTVCFWDNSLSERGTTIALYDYAYYNQTLLGNKSIVLFDLNRPDNNKQVIEKFSKHIEVIGVSKWEEVDVILANKGCDVFYVIKYGTPNHQISKVAKTVIHAVFDCSPHNKHGDVYASISPWVNGYIKHTPVVPHMVHLPIYPPELTFRKLLNIPEDAIVFGRHGGIEKFNISYVQEIVKRVSNDFPNIYFLFVNTYPFYQSKNVIYLDKIIDLDHKSIFINTCDAMLWGRDDGETFGLSIAEFSILNKPVFANKEGKDKAYIHLLGEKAIWYNKDTLYTLLTTFDKEYAKSKDWNAYRNYSPEKVMEIFNNTFLT
jgi:hypothetical protein